MLHMLKWTTGFIAASALACAAALFMYPDMIATVMAQAPARSASPPVPSPKPQLQKSAAAIPETTAPQRTETIVYDSWTVSCRDTVSTGAKKICSATLQIIEQKQRQVLMAWVIGRNNDGALVSVMQTPTGVQITKGVELKFGQGAPRAMPFETCESQRCQASISMDDSMVKEALASVQATATIVAVDGRSVNFNIPTKGIDKAIQAVGR